jgi:hypothetical protein
VEEIKILGDPAEEKSLRRLQVEESHPNLPATPLEKELLIPELEAHERRVLDTVSNGGADGGRTHDL